MSLSGHSCIVGNVVLGLVKKEESVELKKAIYFLFCSNDFELAFLNMLYECYADQWT